MRIFAGAALILLVVACNRTSDESNGTAGCGKDTDCKGNRVCNAGQCTAPDPAALAAALPACPPCATCPDCTTAAAPTASAAPSSNATDASASSDLERARQALLDNDPIHAKLLLYKKLQTGGTSEEFSVLKQACKATSDTACVSACRKKLGQSSAPTTPEDPLNGRQ